MLGGFEQGVHGPRVAVGHGEAAALDRAQIQVEGARALRGDELDSSAQPLPELPRHGGGRERRGGSVHAGSDRPRKPVRLVVRTRHEHRARRVVEHARRHAAEEDPGGSTTLVRPRRRASSRTRRRFVQRLVRSTADELVSALAATACASSSASRTPASIASTACSASIPACEASGTRSRRRGRASLSGPASASTWPTASRPAPDASIPHTTRSGSGRAEASLSRRPPREPD